MPAFQPGDVVSARVVAQGADGTTTLALPKGQIDLRLPVQLPPGTTIALQVETGGAAPRLALLVDAQGRPVTPEAAGPPVQAPTQAVVQAGSPSKTFNTGDLLIARVIGQSGEGATRLALSGGEVTARLPTPVASGAMVAVKVETGGIEPRLALVLDADGLPASPEAAKAQAATGRVRTGPAFPATQATAPSNAGPAPKLPVLETGALLNARVLAQAADGTAKLSVGRIQIDVRLPQGLPVGQTVTLRVESGGEAPKLSLLVDPAGRAVGGDVAKAINAGRPQPAEPVTIVGGPKSLPAAPGTVVGARVVSQSPDGTAQLAIGRTQVRVALPVRVEPGATIAVKVEVGGPQPRLAVLTDTQGRPISGEPARALATARATLPAEATLSRPAPTASRADAAPPEALRKAVEDVRALNAARQDSMAPLFANASVAAAKESPLPQVVQQVLRDLLGFRMPAADATGDQVRTAVQRSGLFHEATVAARPGASQTQGPSSASVGATDGKTMGDGAVARPDGAKPQAGAMQPAAVTGFAALSNAVQALPADLKSTLFLMKAVLTGFLGEEADLPQPARSSSPPPPPRAGDLPRGQLPANATLTGDASPKQAARALLSDTDAALSRIRLSQIASQPSGNEGAPGRSAHGAQWSFEIPLLVGAGTAVAQFQITREDEGASTREEAEAAGWRLRFAVDLPETGAVESLVALGAAGTTVTLWADRPDVAGAMRGSVEELARALGEAGVEVADVRIRQGRPQHKAAGSGHFLDRRT